MTVNELLVLMKIVRERLNELRQLRSQVSQKETYYGQAQKTVEPQYDVKAVDRKITELENFLYMADSAIKTSNATTKVEIEADVKDLLAPLS